MVPAVIVLQVGAKLKTQLQGSCRDDARSGPGHQLAVWGQVLPKSVVGVGMEGRREQDDLVLWDSTITESVRRQWRKHPARFRLWVCANSRRNSSDVQPRIGNPWLKLRMCPADGVRPADADRVRSGVRPADKVHPATSIGLGPVGARHSPQPAPIR